MKGMTHFTLVFEGDIRKIDKNPFLEDTIFGRCVGIGVGNALEDGEKINADLLSAAKDAVAFLTDECDGAGVEGVENFIAAARKLSDQLTAAIKKASGEL